MEQIVELVRIKPVKGRWWSYGHMNIIYENCGVKNYMKEYHRSYKRNFCSCEKKAWKKSAGKACTGLEPSFIIAMIFFHIILIQIIITCFLFSYCVLVTHTETEVNNLPPKEVVIFAIFHLRHKYLESNKLQQNVTNFSEILLNFFWPYYYITSD